MYEKKNVGEKIHSKNVCYRQILILIRKIFKLFCKIYEIIKYMDTEVHVYGEVRQSSSNLT